MTMAKPVRTKAPTEPDCLSDRLCCAPIGDRVLSRTDAQHLAAVLKALADPARLRVLSLVKATNGGESCVADLVAALGLSQATVSHHLRVLTEAGLLDRQRRGNWVWYSVAGSRLDEITSLLH